MVTDAQVVPRCKKKPAIAGVTQEQIIAMINRNGQRLKLPLRAILVAILFVTGVAAQEANRVSGTVVDTTGGAVAAARLTLLNSSGAVAREASTDDAGNFSISVVDKGTYTLRVEKERFDAASAKVVVAETPNAPLHVTLRLQSVRQSVTVNDAGPYVAPDASSSTKLDVPLMELPLSVHVVSAAVLQDQQVISLESAIQNISGVIVSNDGYATADSFTIRGFDQAELTYEDGLRLDQYTNSGFTRDMANVEQVEVVKGPDAVIYGQSEPGGLVNVVIKKPLDTPYFSLQQQFGNYGIYRTTLDASGPLLTKRLLYRFNLDYTDADSFRNFINTRRVSVFPTLLWKPNSRDQVTFEYYYGRGHNTADNGIPFLPNGTPANVPLSRNYADPSANFDPIREYSGKVRASHSFSENWKLRLTYKTQFTDAPTPNFQVYVGDTDTSGNLNLIGFVGQIFKHRTQQVVSDLSGQFYTGRIRHNFDIGFDYYFDAGRYDANVYFPPSINIYTPVYNQPYQLPGPSTDFFVNNGETAYGGYLQDHMTLPFHLFLLLGLRFDRVNTYDTGFGTATDVHDRPTPTPRAGLAWQPVQHLSLYGSYTGIYAATALGALTIEGKPLPPEGGREYETGLKTEWFQKRLTATASVYQIVKTNVPAADPSNPMYSIAIGAARSRGVEFDINGQITPAFRVIGGFSYIDCLILSDTNSPSLRGLRFPGVPFDSGSAFGVYEFQKQKLKGFRVGAGVVGRTGEVAWESPDGVTYSADRIKGFAIVNMMTAYSWQAKKARITAQVNVTNLLNKSYFATVNPSQALPGAPFSIMPALRVQF